MRSGRKKKIERALEKFARAATRGGVLTGMGQPEPWMIGPPSGVRRVNESMKGRNRNKLIRAQKSRRRRPGSDPCLFGYEPSPGGGCAPIPTPPGTSYPPPCPPGQYTPDGIQCVPDPGGGLPTDPVCPLGTQRDRFTNQCVPTLGFRGVSGVGHAGHDYYTRMAHKNAEESAHYANRTADYIEEGANVPPWAFFKLSRVRTDIGDVKHFLDYNLQHPGQGVSGMRHQGHRGYGMGRYHNHHGVSGMAGMAGYHNHHGVSGMAGYHNHHGVSGMGHKVDPLHAFSPGLPGQPAIPCVSHVLPPTDCPPMLSFSPGIPNQPPVPCGPPALPPPLIPPNGACEPCPPQPPPCDPRPQCDPGFLFDTQAGVCVKMPRPEKCPPQPPPCDPRPQCDPGFLFDTQAGVCVKMPECETPPSRIPTPDPKLTMVPVPVPPCAPRHTRDPVTGQCVPDFETTPPRPLTPDPKFTAVPGPPPPDPRFPGPGAFVQQPCPVGMERATPFGECRPKYYPEP